MKNRLKQEIIITYPKAKTAFWIFTDNADLINYFKKFYTEIKKDGTSKYVKNFFITYQGDILEFNKQTIVVKSIASAISTINKLIRQNLEFDDFWIPYHGATLRIGDKIYMFLGSTGAGKTTLAVFLSKQPGVCLISEDITILNWKTTEVIKQIYPICIRSESYELLNKSYGCNLRCSELNYNGKLLYWYNHNARMEGKYMLDKCFVLNRNNNQKAISCVTINSAMPYILNSYCNNDMIRNITSAQFLKDRKFLYQLTYGDLNTVYDFLLAKDS